MKRATKPRRKVSWPALVAGGALGIGASVGCYVDLLNNHQFGVGISQALGLIMAAAAVMLTTLSAAKPLLRAAGEKMTLVNAGIWVSLGMTVLAALSSHLDNQSKDRLHRQSIQDKYAAAQSDAARAQA